MKKYENVELVVVPAELIWTDVIEQSDNSLPPDWD